MSENVKAFFLGLFVIAAIVLGGWFTVFLRPSVGDGKVAIRVRFANIDKINAGTHVTYGGRAMGEVKRIEEVKDPRAAPSDAEGDLYIYELTLKVDSSVQVYTYDEIRYATSGLLGEKSVAIYPRATPPGATPAQNITQELHYGHSEDQLEQALHQFTQVARHFDETLDIFNASLATLKGAAGEIQTLMGAANEKNLIGQLTTSTDRLALAMIQAEEFFTFALSQEGTFGRLMTTDTTYVQLSSVLCQLEAILCDIRSYGLLYQFDRKWQRSRCH